MKFKKSVLYVCLGGGILLASVLGIQYGKQVRMQREIAEKILRFHVRANSDSEEDQHLKLKVRDAVGALLGERMQTASDRSACEKLICASMDEIEETAEQVIEEEGFGYGVRAQLAMVDFPVKTYGDYTFPAGTYEALELVIGEGEGHNWWCVMYPNMCFSDSVYEVVDEEAGEALRKVLTAEEYREVFTEGDYEVRFRYLPFLNEFMEKNAE